MEVAMPCRVEEVMADRAEGAVRAATAEGALAAAATMVTARPLGARPGGLRAPGGSCRELLLLPCTSPSLLLMALPPCRLRAAQLAAALLRTPSVLRWRSLELLLLPAACPALPPPAAPSIASSRLAGEAVFPAVFTSELSVKTS